MPDANEERDLILEIDVSGGRQIINRHPEAVLLFVDVEDSELRKRLRQRGDDDVKIEKRILEAGRERQEAKELNYKVIFNVDLEKATREIHETILKARL